MSGDTSVWRFRTPLTPLAVSERLADSLDRPGKAKRVGVTGVVGPVHAKIFRPPAQGRAPTPLRLDWSADGDGSLVTCQVRVASRMGKQFTLVWRIGWVLIAIMSAPGQVRAVLDLDDGIPSGGPMMGLIVMSLFGMVAIFLPWIVKWSLGVERDLLLAHARQAVDGGAVEEGRE
ncbi:hypothetical protein G5B46_05540 [Caulobacter sp. 602-2]|uniref:Uncharacterized protein n=1 Tax=Caulobacter sp. 602-2 TaxID=2710887 RepID=A0A6G4QUY5_9CAUL|nr:hypothetical protein [Caulobacter sp. 602-2]NGM49065.1 hypothetical protein [Caulobacter sp. 602-2]